MTYKFYRLQVKEGEFTPVGEAQATLHIEPQGTANWLETSEEFVALCLPWFEEPTRWDVADSLVDLKPYSEEALEYLSEVKLPSFGFVMRKIS